MSGSDLHLPNKTWLITGASQGLGLAIALSALRAGHRVLACARNPTKAKSDCPDVEHLGGRWIELDVTKSDCQERVERAVREEEERTAQNEGEEASSGGIDVVVNNGGHAVQGTVEDLSEEQISGQFDVTFYGAVRVLKGVLPSMRRRKTGWIINMSSILGFVPSAEAQAYSAAKFALEALSESYASLLAPFNIKVVILEPGFFKSNLAKSSVLPLDGASQKDYAARTGAWFEIVKALSENNDAAPGDPTKLGDRVVEFVTGTGLSKDLQINVQTDKNAEANSHLLRLILGNDSYQQWGQRLASLNENYRVVEHIANSTDFDRS